MLIQTVPGYDNFKLVVTAMGTPKAVFWWTTGDLSMDTAALFVWAFMDNELVAFNTAVSNNPVGTVASTITLLGTNYPSAVKLTAALQSN